MQNVANMRFAAPPCERFQALSATTGTIDAAIAVISGAARRTKGRSPRVARHASQTRTAAVTKVAEYLTTYSAPAAPPTNAIAANRAAPCTRSAAIAATSTHGTAAKTRISEL